MAKLQGFKQDRIAQILLEEINRLIVLKKVKDPRVSTHVSVLHVNVAQDIKSATVYISSFMEAHLLERTVKALNHAKGFIQAEIHKKHSWRNTPRLFFKSSDGLVHGEKMFNILMTTSQSISQTSLEAGDNTDDLSVSDKVDNNENRDTNVEVSAKDMSEKTDVSILKSNGLSEANNDESYSEE